MKTILYKQLVLIFVLTLVFGCKKKDEPTSPNTNEETPVTINYWKKLFVPSGVNSATVDPTGVLWSATADGVYKSTDTGVSWLKINNGLTMTKSVLIKASLSGNLYVASGTGLFSFTNNTWIDISKKINTSLITFDHLYTFSLDKDGNIYAACFISEKPDASTIGVDKPALFKSTDGGQTWSKIKVQNFDGQIKDITVDSRGYIYVVMDASIYHSTDGGKTFTKALSGLTSANPFVLATNSINAIYTGTGNGVFKSTDIGVNWSNANWTTYCMSVAINSKDAIYVGAINACWLSKDNGLTWMQVSSGLTYSIGGFSDCIIQTFDKNGYALAVLEGVLYRTTNSTF